MPVIAIQPDRAVFGTHSESYSERWEARAMATGHTVRRVDVFRSDAIEQLRGCDAFLWRTTHVPGQKAVARRIIPVADAMLGGRVFPDTRTYWHYDDKVAQKYLMESLGIPSPRTWVFWELEAARAFLATARFPLVLKLAGGAGSANVCRIDRAEEAEEALYRLFGPGVFKLDPQAAGTVEELRRRLRGSAKMLLRGENLTPRSWWELNKNYVLLQEFLPGNEYDTRITVIGGRAFGFRRLNRPGDFRASGSGKLDHTRDQIDPRFVRLAYEAARALGMQALAIDGLYRDGEPVIAEVSYAFAEYAVHDCPGHWIEVRDQLRWVEGHVWPADAIFDDLIARARGGP